MVEKSALLWALLGLFWASANCQLFVFPDDERLQSSSTTSQATPIERNLQDFLESNHLGSILSEQLNGKNHEEHNRYFLEKQSCMYAYVTQKFAHFRIGESGQNIRLSGGASVNYGHLQLKAQGQWYQLCTEDNSWSLQASNVACRQLGYDLGALSPSQGPNLEPLSPNVQNQSLRIQCRGEESNLAQCQLTPTSGSCLFPVGLVCNQMPLTLCPFGFVPFDNKCYGFRQEKLNFLQAQAFCQSQNNGHLAEIQSQVENNFLSEFASRRNYSRQFWTGGVLTSVAGLNLGLWHSSQKSIEFNKFIINLDNENTQAAGVILDLYEGYYFWSASNLSTQLPFVCETDLMDVGCLEDPLGETYQGKAEVTGSGERCIKWTSPGLQQIFAGQQNWDHNYCRNPNGSDDAPFCFIDQDNLDYCQIPRCSEDKNQRREVIDPELQRVCNQILPSLGQESVPSLDSLIHQGSEEDGCPSEKFLCQPGK